MCHWFNLILRLYQIFSTTYVNCLHVLMRSCVSFFNLTAVEWQDISQIMHKITLNVSMLYLCQMIVEWHYTRLWPLAARPLWIIAKVPVQTSTGDWVLLFLYFIQWTWLSHNMLVINLLELPFRLCEVTKVLGGRISTHVSIRSLTVWYTHAV